jgi:hypothetical protein
MGYSLSIALILLTALQGQPAHGADGTTKARKPASASFSYFFASAAYLFWQEPLTLTNPSGTAYKLLATASGPCVGGGWRHVWGSQEFNIQACGFFVNNEVGSTQQQLTYSQLNVPGFGGLIGPGYAWRPQWGGISLGVQVPAIYRTGNYTIPEAGWIISDVSKFSGGILLEATWISSGLSLSQKVGFIHSMGSLWALQFNYHL